MKNKTKVTEFVKGFVDGFVDSPTNSSTHIAAGITAVKSTLIEHDTVQETFNNVAATYLWCAVVDGAYTGLEKILPEKVTNVESK